jgi:hypothetical protein
VQTDRALPAYIPFLSAVKAKQPQKVLLAHKDKQKKGPHKAALLNLLVISD